MRSCGFGVLALLFVYLLVFVCVRALCCARVCLSVCVSVRVFVGLRFLYVCVSLSVYLCVCAMSKVVCVVVDLRVRVIGC